MRGPVANEENALAAEIRGRRVNLTRAARRDVRRAAAIAREENLHSFRIHVDGSITWTPKWTTTAAKPKQNERKGETGSNSGTSLKPSRAEKSRERQAQFYALLEKAKKFRATAVLRWWAKAASIRQQPPPSSSSRGPRAPGDGLPDPALCAAVHAVGASPSRAPPEKIARGEMGARVFRAPAGRAAVPTERVAGAQEAQTICMPMCVHSPGGGATTDPRTPPPRVTQCDISRGSHGVLSGGMDISAPPQRAPHEATAHMATHEISLQRAYTEFMSYHMHQGIAREQANHMWVMYAYRTYGVTYVT